MLGKRPQSLVQAKEFQISSELANDFSYPRFELILDAIKSKFELRLLGDGLNGVAARPQLFLRHDVDVSLKKAMAIAEIEERHNVSATYMVIPHSPFYELQNDDSKRRLRQLAETGHEVGLHFDIDEARRVSNCAISDVEKEINDDCRLLEDITGISVRSVSFHRPIPTFLRGPATICGRTNAYGRQLMDHYISDSRGSWRNGDPLSTLQSVNSLVIQLLIHPIWWGVRHLAPEERLQEFFETEAHGTSAMIDANLAATIPGIRRTANLYNKES